MHDRSAGQEPDSHRLCPHAGGFRNSLLVRLKLKKTIAVTSVSLVSIFTDSVGNAN